MVWIASLSGAGAFANIPQTFTHLQMRVFGRSTEVATSVNMYARFSGDAATVYGGHALAGDGSAAFSSNYLGYDAWEIGAIPAASTTANVFGSHIVDILDYANTNKFKTIRSILGYDANGSGVVSLRSGLWRNTAAITAISITYPPFAAGSRIDLYGITTSQATGA